LSVCASTTSSSPSILYNLLNNAANYAPEGSTVRLDVRALPGDLVEFRVGDDGPGMSEEVLETIFQRFESHANGGRKRGAGLGLSIVKSFVELHSGTVEIRTGRDQGTTVICRLPAIATQSRAAAE
jgi:signal transduction histidine kinase